MYLPHTAIVLYVMVLRRHMCFTTGVVGQTYRLSYQAMRERTEVNRPRGSTKGGYVATTQQLRTMLAQLETAGLIRTIPDQQLVFLLPLALTGSIRANEEQHDVQQHEQQDEQHEEQQDEQHAQSPVTFRNRKINSEMEGQEQQGEQHQEQQDETLLLQQDEQQTSVVFSVQQQQQQHAPPPDADSEGRFLMRAGWKPSKAIDYQMKVSGIVDYHPLILTEFVHHWGNPDNNIRQTQHEWEGKFLHQVIRKTRTATMQVQQRAIQNEGRKVARQNHGTAASRFDEARKRVNEQSVFDDEFPAPASGDFQNVAP